MTPVEALTQIRALCDEADRLGDPRRRALTSGQVRAVLDAVSVDATPPQGIDRSALAKLLDAFIPAEAFDYERLDALTTAVLALGRPVEGIVLSPEDCSRLMSAVVRGGFRTEDPADQALAAHLEAAS